MAGSAANSSLNTELAELLDCPVCEEPMYPPIYQCPNGHTICSNCKLGVKNCCPTCRGEMGEIRSLVLEKIAAALHLPCRYRGSGCVDVIIYSDKQNHEMACKFRPYKCPYPCSPCTVTGDIPIMVGHLLVEHEVICHESTLIDSSFSHADPYSSTGHSFNVDIYSCFGEHFCLHFEALQSPLDMVYMTFLTFIGDDADALNFCYSLEIGNGSRKMSWQGSPRSIREGVSTIRDSLDGFVIHQGVAQNFSKVNSLEMLELRVEGRIWRVSS